MCDQLHQHKYINVGLNSLWARPARLWGVRRPKLKEARAQAQKMKPKVAHRYSRGLHSPRQVRSPMDEGGIQANLKDQKISQGNCP